MKWTALMLAVASLLYLRRRFWIRIDETDMSDQWLSDWQKQRLGETPLWSGASYEGKFKR